MEYEVIFELSKTGISKAVFLLVCPPLIAAGVYMIKYPSPILNDYANGKIFGYIVTLISVFVFCGFFISFFGEHFSIRRAYEEGKFQVVSGYVSDFDPMPKEGHKRESFSVNGVKFVYSDFELTPGFNNATSLGGPIQEGLPVRITYIGNTILKLEVGNVSK